MYAFHQSLLLDSLNFIMAENVAQIRIKPAERDSTIRLFLGYCNFEFEKLKVKDSFVALHFHLNHKLKLAYGKTRFGEWNKTTFHEIGWRRQRASE